MLLSRSTAEDLGVAPARDAAGALRPRRPSAPSRSPGTYVDNQLVGDYLFDAAVVRRLRAASWTAWSCSTARDGTSAASLRQAVDGALAAFPMAEALDREQFTAQAAGQIDVVINIINVLLLLSILIAVLGIVNTLALAVLERTRELGHAAGGGPGPAADPADGHGRGRRRGGVRRAARHRGRLGLRASPSSGRSPDRASASWPSRCGRLVAFVLVAGLAGVLAALLPARRAARLDVLRAIATT